VSKMTYRGVIMQPSWEPTVLEMFQCVLKRPAPIMNQ